MKKPCSYCGSTREGYCCGANAARKMWDEMDALKRKNKRYEDALNVIAAGNFNGHTASLIEVALKALGHLDQAKSEIAPTGEKE